VTIAIHCNLRPPDVSLVVLCYAYKANNTPAYKFNHSETPARPQYTHIPNFSNIRLSAAELSMIQQISLARFFRSNLYGLVLRVGVDRTTPNLVKHSSIIGAPINITFFFSKSERLGFENRGQFSDFLTPVKIRGVIGEMSIGRT